MVAHGEMAKPPPGSAQKLQVSPREATTISVLILTCDRPEELGYALRDLADQSRTIGQLIVVNNSRDEGPTRAVVEELGPLAGTEVLYLRASPVFGTASGRNAGLDESTGDIVFLFDDDVRLPSLDYLDRVGRVFETDSDRSVGAVTTLAGTPESPELRDRTRLRARRLVKQLFGVESGGYGRVTRSGFQSPLPVSGDGDLDWLQGGASAIRHEVALSVRFDEGLERQPLALSEDVEFGLQVRQRWRIRMLGDAMVVNGHVKRKGTATQWLKSDVRYELLVRNYDRINRRHRPGKLNRAAFWWAMLGVGLERLAATAIGRPGSGPALKGYCRGLWAVLKRDDRVVRPTRIVQRLTFGARAGANAVGRHGDLPHVGGP
jgi:glycosyltransferase involved in cell wall biosynthesis